MRNYTLIGNPLGHSMSPLIHERLFSLAGREASYTLTEIPPEDLENRMPALRALDGYNITIPHKVGVIPFLDELDESAERYHSVNCVANRNGKAVGYNTDCDGFLRSVADMPLSGRVLLIGCGGVGRMMGIEAALHGAELTLGILEQDRPLAERLCEEIAALSPSAKVHTVLSRKLSGSFDLLVNACPVGMYPKTDACPVSEEIIAGSGSVFDAIYNPTETRLIRQAKAMGKPAAGGAAMLVWQAVRAHEIWDGDSYTTEQVQGIIRELQKTVNRDFPLQEG
jgi:shikimate dehydrogenase